MVRTHKHQLKVKHMILQVATDKCIMAFLFLIVVGVIAIIVVKVYVQKNIFSSTFFEENLCHLLTLFYNKWE